MGRDFSKDSAEGGLGSGGFGIPVDNMEAQESAPSFDPESMSPSANRRGARMRNWAGQSVDGGVGDGKTMLESVVAVEIGLSGAWKY